MQEKGDLQHALHPRDPHQLSPSPVPEPDPQAYPAPSVDFEPEDLEPRPFTDSERKRAIVAASVLLVILLLVVLPPLINMNRFRRQIATSIGASLGRPVHMDAVTLDLLPMPGFTLQNFVVGEDPAFGSEPTIRANQVQARLRVASLWRRRVEFSRIEFEDPSVNLVHIPDGRWNVESILLQAAHVQAAPTAQKGAGDAPRFPYIEATGARLNVKMGLEKKPFSLTDAKFSLWLASPEQWQLRLEAHPSRTDTAATDTGIMRLEGTLGRASHLAEVPVELAGEWTAAPLGAVTWILLGRDAGLRGEMTVRTSVHGTLGSNQVDSKFELRQVRRADFVPLHTLEADLTCKAQANGIFHQVDQIRCLWPVAPKPANSPRPLANLGSRIAPRPSAQAGNQPRIEPQPRTEPTPGLILTGQIPESLRPGTGAGLIVVADTPASGLLDLLRIFSPRVSPTLTFNGIVATRTPWPLENSPAGFSIADAQLTLGTAPDALNPAPPFLNGPITGAFSANQLFFEPVALNLGGPTPALLEGHASPDGFAMRLTGLVLRSRLLALAAGLPQFGDGLEAALPAAPAPAPQAQPNLPNQVPPASAIPKPRELPIRIDLVSTRTWFGQQVWTPAPAGHTPRTHRVR